MGWISKQVLPLGFWDPEAPTLTMDMTNISNFPQPLVIALQEELEGEAIAEPTRELEDAVYTLQPQHNSKEFRSAEGS